MGVLRRGLELLARGRVLKRSVLVGGQRVTLFVSPDAQLKYLKPGLQAFDRDLIRIAERFLGPRSVVWDLGANVGVFAFAAAAVARQGTVLAVEADAWLATLLRRSQQLPGNRGRDVRVLPAAVSDREGVASFLIAARGRASNALAEAGGRSEMGGVRETHFVPTLRLDTLLETFPAPDFVKVDVEGAELLALRGATRLLEEVRPTCYVEVGPEVSAEVLERFTAQRYLAFDPAGRRLSQACARNTFFVPEENQAALRLVQAP